MKKIIKLLRPILILGARTWWYITRPVTSGAKVVLVSGDEILLIKTTYGYNYSLPGGGVKRGESPREAAIREVYEEVGILLAEVTPLPSFITYEEYKEDTVYGFYSLVQSKAYKLDRLEIDMAEWHPLNNLPTTGPVTEKIITLYKEHALPY
jgi:8-oxo-dGTP pyrophosphatase MutT (NUDIX family)